MNTLLATTFRRQLSSMVMKRKKFAFAYSFQIQTFVVALFLSVQSMYLYAF